MNFLAIRCVWGFQTSVWKNGFIFRAVVPRIGHAQITLIFQSPRSNIFITARPLPSVLCPAVGSAPVSRLVSFLKRLAAKDNADVQWSVSAERICNVCKMRCAQSDCKAICPYCGSLDTYLSRYAHDAAWRETQNRRCDRRRVELVLSAALAAQQSR